MLDGFVKQHAQALANSEKKMLTYLDCSPVCTKIVDLDFKLTYTTIP